MKTIDLKEKSVRELDLTEAVNMNGGVALPVVSPWLTTLVAYIKYSMDTGGTYVIHHAQ